MSSSPHTLRLLLVLPLCALLLLPGACGDAGSPTNPITPPDTTPTQPPPPDPDSATATVGAGGGSALLPDGSGVIFPAGAVASNMAVTVRKVAASTWFEGTATGERVLLSTKAPVSQFATEVEVRVPLPSTATPADSLYVLAGVVDEESGAVEVERATIQLVDGKPFLVVKTTHFTTRVFEWFFGKTPPASAQLVVPYYGQGSSSFCWAASLHMVTQAASFGEVRLLAEIIGEVGVDEGGIGPTTFRTSGAIASLVKSRTGVKPDRQTWDAVNKNLARDLIRREIGLNGRPVALFMGPREHAVVVVGYEGNGNTTQLIVHDPASLTPGSVGYKTLAWTDVIKDFALNDKLVTLVVPREAGTVRTVTINFLSQALHFAKPADGAEDPSALYRFVWDHRTPSGYAFRHASTDEPQDPLPGTVRSLATSGDIEVANASRTDSKEVSVWFDVTAMGAPQGVGRYSTQKSITLGPNSVGKVKLPDIPVDTFRYNAPEPVEYRLTVTAMAGGTAVDRQSVTFRVAPATPQIIELSPNVAAVGDEVTLRGERFGTLRFNNAVSFDGVAVDSIVSWKDDQIVLLVPEGAETGKVAVFRGEVPSNQVDFTLSELKTITGTVSRSYGEGYMIPNVTADVSGTWTLKAGGAKLDRVDEDTYKHHLLAEMGEPVELTLNFSGTTSPGQLVQDNGDVLVLKPLEWSFKVVNYGGSAPTQTGAGGERTFTLTQTTPSEEVCIQVRFDLRGDLFDGSGVFKRTRDLNAATPAQFCVKPLH